MGYCKGNGLTLHSPKELTLFSNYLVSDYLRRFVKPNNVLRQVITTLQDPPQSQAGKVGARHKACCIRPPCNIRESPWAWDPPCNWPLQSIQPLEAQPSVGTTA